MTQNLIFALFVILPSLAAAEGGARWKEAEVIAYGKEISAARLEKGLPNAPLEKWLTSTIGGPASLTWEAGDCGESTGAPGDNPPLCVEIEAKGRTTYQISISIGGMAEGIIKADPNYPHLFAVYKNGKQIAGLDSILGGDKVTQENN